MKLRQLRYPREREFVIEPHELPLAVRLVGRRRVSLWVRRGHEESDRRALRAHIRKHGGSPLKIGVQGGATMFTAFAVEGAKPGRRFEFIAMRQSLGTNDTREDTQ